MDTISIVKFAKGHNSVKNADGVTVLVLCMSIDDALYLYTKLNENIQMVFKL